MKNNIGKLSIAVFMIAITFNGCSNKDLQVAELEKQLESKASKIETQEKTVNAKTAEIESLKKELETTKAEAKALEESVATQTSYSASSNSTASKNDDEETSSSSIIDNASLTPPNAKAGECYAKVLIPAEYETTTEEKLLTSKVENLHVTKPTYKNVKYKILDKAESFKYVLIPATYKCVQNRVMVEPEKVTYKVIPATFKEVEETIMISPARKVWKKGKGPITKISNHTGDIMCLVEIPAKYKTVKTKVIDEPARTEKVITPAVYKNIKAKVIDQEARTEKVIIPATYKTVTVQELDTEASVDKDVKEETYQTVEKTRLVKPEELKWQRILCETNTNKGVIKELQQALKDRGYNPGTIDGVYGANTQRALNAFQLDNDLPSGALTLESLEALGLN
ncbi:MAG: hypothetical protein GXO30_00710 [Epsilonproteobacteria bacterium]|nr:hypothetical protein [Campylobacterota bacterium]